MPVQRRKTIEKHHLLTVKREGYKLAEPRGTISYPEFSGFLVSATQTYLNPVRLLQKLRINAECYEGTYSLVGKFKLLISLFHSVYLAFFNKFVSVAYIYIFLNISILMTKSDLEKS